MGNEVTDGIEKRALLRKAAPECVEASNAEYAGNHDFSRDFLPCQRDQSNQFARPKVFY